MYHCIYQILHNEIKQLKIKRKSKHKGKRKSFSNGILVCSAWLSLPTCPAGCSGQSQRVPAGLTSPDFSTTAGQSSSVSPRRMIFSTTFNCSFCFFPRPEVYFWQVSFHAVRVLLAQLPYSALISSATSYPVTIVFFEYLVGPTVFQIKSNPLNTSLKASYRLLPPTPRDFTSHSP